MTKITKSADIDNNLPEEQSNFLLYTGNDGAVKVDVFIQNETLWLTQAQIAELFGVQRPAITKHLSNIFKSDELDENSVCSILEHTAKDEKSYKTKYYNLDAILSIGYRVNSRQATHFRQWASARLKEFIIKGFTMDDERLKNPNQPFGKDYFDEQLERIRDVRSSERRFYQKITDIYAQCSADYEVNSETTRQFFASAQNKLHWAIVGETAAEIIYHRADSQKENMGLTSWRNAPKGLIRKTDVVIAKNYLSRDELDFFNRIVTMYLDFAEMQAKNKKIMVMEDWVKKLDVFLAFNEKDILNHKGKISHKVAKALAEQEYEKYRVIKDSSLVSDFDLEIMKEIDTKDQ